MEKETDPCVHRVHRPVQTLIEPSANDKHVTKVGEKVYQTREQAEADLKLLCKA
jgi:hypothetical protein